MYPSYDMILLRKSLLEEIMNKRRSVNEVADILSVRRETISRWLAQFRFAGMDGIIPKKPGPKKGVAPNRSSAEIEAKVVACARANPFKGPVGLADELSFSLHPNAQRLSPQYSRNSLTQSPSSACQQTQVTDNAD